MARFDDYATKYQTIRMERRDGILQMTFHTDGGPLQWGLLPHGEFPQAFRDVGSDPDTKVVILTGTGDTYSGPRAAGGTGMRSTPAAVGSRLLGGQAPADEPARHRGADDQRDQRPGLAALRDPAAVRHRARRRRRAVPGLGPLPERDGAGRRHAHRLPAAAGLESRPLLPADRANARRGQGAGAGSGQRAAAARRSPAARMGAGPSRSRSNPRCCCATRACSSPSRSRSSWSTISATAWRWRA